MAVKTNAAGLLNMSYIGQVINDWENGISYTLVYSTRHEVLKGKNTFNFKNQNNGK